MKKRIILPVVATFMLFAGVHALAEEYVVESATPAQGAYDVQLNQPISVTFTSDIGLDQDAVTINDSKEHIASVSVEGNVLTIQPKNQESGTNYRVQIDRTVYLSYTTEFSDSEVLLDFSGEKLEKFYGGRKLYAQSVGMENGYLVMRNSSTQTKGGRFYSSVVDLEAQKISKIEIGLRTNKDFTANLYYSPNDNYTGFTTEQKLSFAATAGEDFTDYTLDLTKDTSWNQVGKIKQLMFESEEVDDTCIEIAYIRFIKSAAAGESGLRTGTMRICTGFETPLETDITEKALPGGTIYGVLDRIKNETQRDQTAALIVAYYSPEGVLTGVKYRTETIPAGEQRSISLALENTEAGGKVRVFLRRSILDIRTIAAAVETV